MTTAISAVTTVGCLRGTYAGLRPPLVQGQEEDVLTSDWLSKIRVLLVRRLL